VAVAMNDMPFLRNHFFEQEFFDLAQVEVLRGPQGTLYGRNATAGVVNLTTAKPSDQFEAMASAEFGNYGQKRFEGMINLPIVDDRLAVRLAGEWTKRHGYSFNESNNSDIDGRNLWSGRLTIGWKPSEKLQTYLVWEHFSEDDDRLRSAKQTCKTDHGPSEVGGVAVPKPEDVVGGAGNTFSPIPYVSQGCLPASFYSDEAFQLPNGYSLPYYGPTSNLGNPIFPEKDPYANTTQSKNLRHIESQINPGYKAKSDIVQFNADYRVTPELTFTSQTGYNSDYLWSTQDYNRFNTLPGVFNPNGGVGTLRDGVLSPEGVFCDPQLGCSDRLIAQDLATEHSWQVNQEFRLASNFSGPFNFSVGGNYMHYETMEKYYVFINSIGLFAATSWGISDLPYVPNVSDNSDCIGHGKQLADPTQGYSVEGCIYMDTGTLDNLNDDGHNYFLSKNPYIVDSYAGFGEAYYNVTSDLKLTGGLRWTADRKHFPLIPSWLAAANSYGYPVAGSVDQSWDEFTGRTAVNWTPKLDFTDQTLIYASYAHGYKAGGANPPQPVVTGAVPPEVKIVQSFAHPLTFKPEFVDAFELGTKNTLFDGALTLNGDVFYYNYQNYQISEIVDRTSINQNFDAHIKGAELEMTWEPVPGLRFNAGGGYEDARLADGSKAIDLMDRTAGHAGWHVFKPFPTNPSNCILPDYVVTYGGFGTIYSGANGNGACITAYKEQFDPITGTTYTADPDLDKFGNPADYGGYPGFDPSTAPNNGEGFDKDLSHNEMPNAPPFTFTFGAQYSMPVSPDWAATLRGDLYWQDASYWRVFNDMDYDKLHAYSNLNVALILTSQNGWQAMAFVKNVFDTTAITGAFLNSDDSGLTTNVFVTDPRLFGIRVTKNW
jgi:outer membrane receptor protein involved in Fe transport